MRSLRARSAAVTLGTRPWALDDAGVGPIQAQPGEGHLHRTDGGNDLALRATEALNHGPGKTVQSRISAHQHGHSLPCRPPQVNLLQHCGNIAFDKNSLRGTVGE